MISHILSEFLPGPNAIRLLFIVRFSTVVMAYVGAVLCGGYGMRLRPITEEIPKPLLDLSMGYSILDKQLLHFKSAGIGTVYLLAGHLHEKLAERYGTLWDGIEIKYLIEKKPGGTLFALNNLFEACDDDVIVMNGDIVTDMNLEEMIHHHKKPEMLMFITPLISPFGIVEISDSKVISFREKPILPYHINGGIYVMDSSLRSYCSKYTEGNVETLVFPAIARDGLLRYYREDDVFWHSVESAKDLEIVQSEYANKEDKPWGYEKTIVSTEKYLTKELYVKKGTCTSFHYHERKDETLHVFRGEGYIEFTDKKVLLRKNEQIRIHPGVPHSIHAVENLLLNEYSTPHPRDTIRMRDPYER